jgi:hypothetical protein
MARESRGDKARRQIIDLNISGLSDAEIGRRIGVNRSTVGRWRKGETKPRKGGKGGRLTRLWKRTDKVLGQGGTVNLTSFFRRIWVKDGEPQLPLTIQTLPTYQFPNNAPVYVLAKFSDWIVDFPQYGVENWNDKMLRANIKSDSDIEGLLSSELIGAIKTIRRESADGKVIFARMEFVLLRRGAN